MKSASNGAVAAVAAEIIERSKARHPHEVGEKSDKREVKTHKVKAPKAATTPKPKAEKKVKVMPDCACGCAGQTKGGVYLPGHDSKHRAAMAGPKVMPECACGCGGQTKGGTWLPGHDAKHHSKLLQAEREKAKTAKAASKRTSDIPRKKVAKVMHAGSQAA